MDDPKALPPPKLLLEDADETQPSATTLEELLEDASRIHATALGEGPLVGECLDTHNPHLPGRVLVRARGEDGDTATAWLSTLSDLRIRAGDRVVLDKPRNWPEPVVLGVLTTASKSSSSKASPPLDPDGPHVQLEPGSGLTVVGPKGEALLRLSATPEGDTRIQLLPAGLDLDVHGKLRLSADRLELRARDGIDMRTEGDTIVRAHVIRLN